MLCGAETCYEHAPQGMDLFLRMTDLFAKVVDFENLHVAYCAARASKRYRSSILKFGYRIEENLVVLHRSLQDKTYHHGDYRECGVAA
jgi:hypothetical protein